MESRPQGSSSKHGLATTTATTTTTTTASTTTTKFSFSFHFPGRRRAKDRAGVGEGGGWREHEQMNIGNIRAAVISDKRAKNKKKNSSNEKKVAGHRYSRFCYTTRLSTFGDRVAWDHMGDFGWNVAPRERAKDRGEVGGGGGWREHGRTNRAVSSAHRHERRATKTLAIVLGKLT